MKIQGLIFSSLFIIPFMSSAQETKKDSMKNIKVVEAVCTIWVPIVSAIPIKTKFKTLKEWILNICEDKEPQKSIERMIFGYQTSSTDEYKFYFYGVNTYLKESQPEIRIDFEPSNMAFKPPKSAYKNLSQQQMREKIVSQLKDIVNTEKFKNSFLAKFNCIEFSGEEIPLKAK